EAIGEGLRPEGFFVDLALNGDDALEKVAVNDYDVVVLDRDIPGTHGDDVCVHVATHHPEVRVLMLTAAARLRDKVDGFELGADDYLPKPFAFEELIARLRSLGRRPTVAVPTVLTAGDLQVDSFRRTARRGSRAIPLTRKQFGVLEVLLKAGGGVVSSETLLEKVWDEHADPFTSAPRVTVSKLRRALGEPALVETVAGEGYRISVAPA